MTSMTTCMSKRNVTVDFMTRTIFISKTFLNRSQTVNSPEFLMLESLVNRFPNYNIETMKVYSSRARVKGITYSQMETYINVVESEPEKALMEFQLMRKLGSYGTVRTWFLRKYPDCMNPCEDFKLEIA